MLEVDTQEIQSKIQFLFPQIKDNKVTEKFCEFCAVEYFKYPEFKLFIRDLFKRKLMLNTNPVEQNNLKVFNIFYPTKRIRNLKLKYIDSRLFLLVVQSFKQDLITISYSIDMQDKKCPIYAKLVNYLGLSEQYQAIRVGVVQKVKELCYKNFREEVVEEYYKSAQQIIMQEIGNKFRNFLSNKSHFGGRNVLSVVFGILKKKTLLICSIVDGGGNILKVKEIKKESFVCKVSELVGEFGVQVVGIYMKNHYSLQLKQALENEIQNGNILLEAPLISFVNDVPQLISNKNFNNKDENFKKKLVGQAVSICRFIQNPLEETLMLWDEKLINDLTPFLVFDEF